MIKIIKQLPKIKANTFIDILVDIVIISAHTYSHALRKIFRNCVKMSKFSCVLKYADIIPGLR